MSKRKKTFRFAALLLSLALLFCACGEKTALYEINGENAWFSYPVEQAPVKAVNAGEKWYLLMGKYLGDSFSLSVSESYENVNTVYSTSGVDIWFFEANESLAAWCEESAAEIKFMVYNAESGKTEEIFSASTEKFFRAANVGVHGKKAYFEYTDYENETAAIMCYDTEDGKLSRFAELEYRGEYSCTSLYLHAGNLTVSYGNEGKAELLKINLESGEKTKISLSAAVNFVYACSYDSAEGGYAVYYRDADGKEHVATVNPKSGNLKNLFTFAQNVYAYHDTVSFYGGHLYWVQQVNATGNVAEHYKFVDYDCSNDTADEYLKTFCFSLAEDGVTLLAFNGVTYTAIYITEIYLGGQ